jgi:hypothetical protein
LGGEVKGERGRWQETWQWATWLGGGGGGGGGRRLIEGWGGGGGGGWGCWGEGGVFGGGGGGGWGWGGGGGGGGSGGETFDWLVGCWWLGWDRGLSEWFRYSLQVARDVCLAVVDDVGLWW